MPRVITSTQRAEVDIPKPKKDMPKAWLKYFYAVRLKLASENETILNHPGTRRTPFWLEEMKNNLIKILFIDLFIGK